MARNWSQRLRIPDADDDAWADCIHDPMLRNWLLSISPEARLRAHDDWWQWARAINAGKIRLFEATDNLAPPPFRK